MYDVHDDAGGVKSSLQSEDPTLTRAETILYATARAVFNQDVASIHVCGQALVVNVIDPTNKHGTTH